MKNRQTQIDAGHVIIALESAPSRTGPIITAYVNGMSIRSSSLKFARMANAFIECVLSACAFPEDGFSEAHEDRVADEIGVFIDGTNKVHNITEQ
jgi:hypothetical protein